MANLQKYMQREYPFEVLPDPEGGFVAWIPDLPGCYSAGSTKLEAIERLDDAKEAWIESCCAMQQEIPAPTEEPSFSGRVLLRMPRSLHKTLQDQAAKERTALSDYAVFLLADGAARMELARRQAKPRGRRTTRPGGGPEGKIGAVRNRTGRTRPGAGGKGGARA